MQHECIPKLGLHERVGGSLELALRDGLPVEVGVKVGWWPGAQCLQIVLKIDDG